MKLKNLNKNKKIAIFGCKETTKDLILKLIKLGYKINYCYTLNSRLGKKEKVSGYYDLTRILKKNNIPFNYAKKYSLNSETDKKNINKNSPDIILCMGWQRLIPQWLLNKLSVGAFGMHGSSKPLPHGRGRSPMNWSLIQNKEIFYTNLFKYDSGVDDGLIVGTQKFDITQWDTCNTLHIKNTIAMNRLCAKFLPKILNGTIKYYRQGRKGVSYYPKRNAEDGLIFWKDSTKDIYNLVRAVTKPFPGAFTFFGKNKKLHIWKAIPFDSKLRWSNFSEGKILDVFYDGTFLVKTGDSSLLILEYDGITIDKKFINRKLGNSKIKRKVWKDLPS